MYRASSYRPGEVQRQPQPAVLLLDAEGAAAQNRCNGSAKNAVSGRHHGLVVFQTNPEECAAAAHAATLSICQQTLRILKVMEIELEHT